MLGAHFKTSANDTTQIDYSKIYTTEQVDTEISILKFWNPDSVVSLIESGFKPNQENLDNFFQYIYGAPEFFEEIIKLGLRPSLNNLLNSIHLKNQDNALKIAKVLFSNNADKLNVVNALINDDLESLFKLFQEMKTPKEEILDLLIDLKIEKIIIKNTDAGLKPNGNHLLKAIDYKLENLAVEFVKNGLVTTSKHLSEAIDKRLTYLSKVIFENNPKLADDLDQDITTLSVSSPHIGSYLLKNATKSEIYNVLNSLIAKGQYTQAKIIFENSKAENLEIDPLTFLTEAILKAIDVSVSKEKFQAFINLLHRFNILDKYSLSKNNLDFISGSIHKLAKHYLLNASKEMKESEIVLEKAIESQKFFMNDKSQLANENFCKKEVYESTFGNQIITKREFSSFEKSFLSFIKALDQLDHDFALEIVALNGIIPPQTKDVLTAYRGIHYNLSDEEINDMFIYGHRAFSKVPNQKTLGYYVNFGTKYSLGSNSWELGGTYLSLEPKMAAYFSKGTATVTKYKTLAKDILIEAELKSGEPLIFGPVKFEYEIVPSGLRSDETVAVYQLDENLKVIKVYNNPHIQKAPSYQVGDEIAKDQKAIDSYNNLFNSTDAFKYYENDQYSKFLEKYTYQPERLDQFYENRPELPNLVCISPKALSEIRLDMDVYSHMCIEE